ncbi:MAG: Sec-independent protein translocase protein TatB [Usitatibacter sp.]
MFDIGISELMVVGVVALVVIGPERLPKVARTVGVLFGRLQRYVTQVKSDISREMELAELGKVKTEFEDAARSFKTEVETKAADAQRELRDAQASIESSLSPAEGAAADVATPPAEAMPEAEHAPASPQLELGIEDAPAPARDNRVA